jgi:hypothetical protein
MTPFPAPTGISSTVGGSLPAGSIGVVEKVNLACEAAQLTEFWCQQVLPSTAPSRTRKHDSCSSGPR